MLDTCKVFKFLLLKLIWALDDQDKEYRDYYMISMSSINQDSKKEKKRKRAHLNFGLTKFDW